MSSFGFRVDGPSFRLFVSPGTCYLPFPGRWSASWSWYVYPPSSRTIFTGSPGAVRVYPKLQIADMSLSRLRMLAALLSIVTS